MATKRRRDADGSDGPVVDYRHDATRPNNPPAALASQGSIREARKQPYHYDPHLPPTLRFDDTGQADRVGELLATARHRKLTGEEANFLDEAVRSPEPWLEWTGKREGKSWFEVDPVALHIHERVSAQAAIRIAARQNAQRSLWADPELEYHEAVQFYKHDVDWSNRLILGDSLAVMNSLAVREDLAGKVQMIYVDPPYGIRFASNFQPFVGSSDVRDTDADLTREPEVVKAYRDTWTLGVHTYLAYLRDRLTVARDLLTDSGSIFVQIGSENVHRVRAVLDEVFRAEEAIATLRFRRGGFQTAAFLPETHDYVLWYSKSREQMKFRRQFKIAERGEAFPGQSIYGEYANGMVRRLDRDEIAPSIPRIFCHDKMSSASGSEASRFDVEFEGSVYRLPRRGGWSTNREGVARMGMAGRLFPIGSTLRRKKYFEDSPFRNLTTDWSDTTSSGFGEGKRYVVETQPVVIQRCMLMTTDPGDLVLDPTCGSGTTAYVAEQWGRRWITIDTSRVAIALARERILTAKFDYYKTADGSNSIDGGGFEYKTVPHVTLRSIAQNVALDPIFARWEPVLDDNLDALNDALAEVGDETRAKMLEKLDAKRRARGRNNRVTDADERRWRLPKDRWEHWQVPFDADPDWPDALTQRLESYRKAWRGKMDEVDACIAANADQETLVDQPEVDRGVVRVSGPFTVESVHPPEESLGAESPIGGAPEEIDGFGVGDSVDTDGPANTEAFHDKLTRLLRKDSVRFQGNGIAKFTRLERLADGNVLHAEGEWENGGRVAVAFGPQYGAVTAKQVEDSIRAAFLHGYDTLLFAGFSFDGAAQAAIQDSANPNVTVHMTHIAPDVNMGDLLKETKDSQLFSVSGLPRTNLTKRDSGDYVIEMEGVDVYDPVNNTIVSENADGVAAWFLDSDYDGRTFCTSQAFFPDSNAWNKLARALKSVVDAEAFAAFGGTKSLPFPRGEHGRAAVKVIDPRGNEVMSVHELGDGSYRLSPAGSMAHEAPASTAQDEFERLSAEWRADRPRGADVTQMVEHAAYKRIIDMGPAAIPLILRELDREVDHWFWALHELTGADPVPEDDKGDLPAMAEAWLNWGKSKGHIQ